MLKYTFSRREKVLVVLLVIAAIAICWYFFVFQASQNRILELDNQISAVQTEASSIQAKAKKMKVMEEAIEEYKDAGVTPKKVPQYDNSSFLMAQLDLVMAQSSSYSLSFGEPDMETSDDYVLRPVSITYGTNTLEEAEAIVKELEDGKYPCHIDSFTIADSTTGTNTRAARAVSGAPVSATVKATYYEEKTDELKAALKAAEKNKDSKSSKSASKKS